MLNNVNKLYVLIFVTICQRRLPHIPLLWLGLWFPSITGAKLRQFIGFSKSFPVFNTSLTLSSQKPY